MVETSDSANGLAFFARGERGITPSSGWRIRALALRITGEAARLMGIEIADCFFHVHGFGCDVEHHRRFDFVGVRAAGLAKLFLDGVIFGQIGEV